jgi:hypothetical protein
MWDILGRFQIEANISFRCLRRSMDILTLMNVGGMPESSTALIGVQTFSAQVNPLLLTIFHTGVTCIVTVLDRAIEFNILYEIYYLALEIVNWEFG